MTEVKIIKATLAKEGEKAYLSRKSQNGAYVMRGNAIVRVTQDGSINVVKRVPQTRVRLKDQDKLIIIK